ncbi:MAG: hypothetical protein IPM08_14410 [Actinomycetales bacterium]|nr:hypothetical protein [Actinomycetales bacterium]
MSGFSQSTSSGYAVEPTTVWRRWVRFVAVLAAVAVVGVLGSVRIAFAADGPPTLVSDQADYPPGGTVVLSGANWASGEQVHIVVNDDAGQTWSLSSGSNGAAADPVAGPDGSIAYTFQLPAWFVATYTATATGASGTASVSFTDSPVKAFDQCANDLGNGYPSTSSDPGCQWINGNLQQSNSVYNEGDSTVQRLALTGLMTGQTYTLVFTYQTSKGGLHAYDYLTTYNASETWVADQCQGLTPCSIAGASTYPIPTTTSQSGGQNFTMYGGTMTNASIAMPASYAGDTTATVTLTFTATGADTVLWFGAHVASQLDWGTGQGAGSISGSPYHVSLVSLNGASLGSMDNQMASGAVQKAGTVTIIKDAIPNSAQDFSFTLASATSSKTFPLDDDADPTLSNTATYKVAPGTWTLTEAATSGWDLSSISCVGGTYTVSGATATLTVESDKTITCTYTNKYVYSNLVVSKTATTAYNRDWTWTITKSVTPESQNVASGATADFEYTVTAVPTAHESGFVTSGVITVSNPNDVPVPGVSLIDTMTGGTCSITGTTSGITVAAGATLTFPYTCTFASKPAAALTNTATATWTAGMPYGTTGTASGTATADFAQANVAVTGQTITVTDDKTDPAHPVVLGTADATVPSSQVFTYTLTKTAPAGGCTSFTNTAWLGTDTAHPATATASICGGSALEVSKTASPSFTRDWTWDVTKVAAAPRVIADPTSGTATASYTVTATPTKTDSAWTVTGTITLHNPNSVAITGVTVTDSLPGATCSTGTVPSSIAAGATETVSYTCTFASDPGAGTLTNTVTASWADSGYVKAGSISATASTTFAGLAPTVEHGTTTEVTDPQATTGLPATATAPAGGSYEVTATWTNPNPGTCQSFDNTASVTGDSASASVEVCRAADLTVTKTATGSYDTTYAWAIDKKLGDVPGVIPSGSTVDYPYTLTVTKAGQTDSGWVVTGTITVTNPNTWQAVTLTGVSDALSVGGASCVVTGDQGQTIPASGSAQFGYTCTYAAQPTAYEGSNTATATWAAAAAHTAAGSASGSAAYTLALAGETNKTVTVTDTQHDSWTLDWATAGSSTDLSYTLTRTAPQASCTTFENTAAVVGDNAVELDSDTVSQDLCGASPLTVTKTANAGYTQTYPWTIAKSVDKTSIVVGEGGDTTVTYTVDVTRGTPTPTAWTLSGDIVVHNPNAFESITATVSDTVDIAGLTCSITGDATVTILPGADATLPYTCSVAAGADPATLGTLSGTNTATATWDASAAHTAVGTATGSAGVTGTLTGSVDASITVTDPMAPNGVVGTFTESGSASYDVTLTGSVGQCQTIDNTATISSTGQSDSASVQLCIVKAPTATKTAAGTFTRTYDWTIAKSAADTLVEVAPDGTATFTYTVTATPGATTDSDWAMTGTVTVTNPNAFPVSATVTDLPYGAAAACTYPNGATVAVSASGSADVAYACTGLGAPPAVASNTATVAWTAEPVSGQPVSGTASASISPVVFTETNSVDKSIVVWDDKTGDTPVQIGTAVWDDPASQTITYSVTKPASDSAPGSCTSYDNTASFDTAANADTATATVQMCVGADLVVDKTAVGSYDTTYTWAVDKTFLDFPGSVAAGTEVTIPYEVTAIKTGQIDSGWTVSGTITVTNLNTWQPVTLTGVTDSLTEEGASCTITGDQTATLAEAGGTVTLDYTCTYAVAPESYSGTNVATVTWDQAAAFTAHGSAVGTTKYTMDLAHETNAEVTVTDTMDGVTTTLGTAAIGESPKTFGYSKVVTAPTGSCLTVDNTATIIETGATDTASATVCGYAAVTATKSATGSFARDWDWAIAKDAAATQLVADPTTGAATATYTVTVTPSKTDSGAVVSGSVTVTNPNDVALTATVTDALGDVACAVTPATVEVPANGSVAVNYTCTLASVPTGTVTNTATVTWPAVSYVPAGQLSPSATVDFGAVVPTETDDTVTFTDPNAPASSYGPFAAADGVQSVEYTHTWTGTAGTCVDFTNTATLSTGGSDDATVQVCRAAAITATKSATGAYARDWTWTVDKTGPADRLYADPATGDVTAAYSVVVTPTKHDTGATVTGSITVTNPNDVALTVTVSDVMAGATCQLTSDDRVLPAKGTLTVTYSCALDAVPTGSVDNTATVSWPATGYVAAGQLTPSASVDFAAVTPVVTNATTTVTDPVAGWAGDATVVSAGDGSATTLTYSHVWNVGTAGTCQTFENTATLSTGGSDSATVEACRGADLTVTKTVATSYHRDYDWTITKTAAAPQVSTPAGTPVTSSYDIVVAKAGSTDSTWTMTGTITVTNPNTWQSITADVVDLTDIGASCTVSGGSDVVIAAGQSVPLAYSCTFASQPAYTGSNTATVTWDAAAAHTATGTASGSATVDFGAPTTESDRTITVTDTPAGGSAKTLGTLDYLSAPASTTYTDTITRDGVAGTCTAYDNTAAITETGQSASASVTVCVGRDLTVTKTAAGGYTRTYDWTIAKSASPATQTIAAGQLATVDYGVTVTPNGYTDSAQALTGTITLTNSNDWQDITATVTDVVDIAGVTCTITEGAAVTVPKSGTATVHYTCSGDYAGDYTGTNTATATWDAAAAATPTGTASGTADVALTQTAVNDTITVTDTPAGQPTVTLGTATWADGPHTFPTYSAQFGGVAGTCTAYENTASITEIPGRSATASTEVCVGADVTVSKTAAGTFTRTYPWTITKSAAETQVQTTPAGDAVFSYTVAAIPGAPVDSAWSMGGTITVTNPNDFQPVTVDITDVPNVGGGAVCTVTDGAGVIVPAGGSASRDYTCTLTGMPSSYSAGTNTATATVTSGTVSTAAVTSSAAPVVFTEATSVDKSVTVLDDKTVPGASTSLGTADWNAAGTPVTFTYSVTQHPTAVGACTAYTNTAWIDLATASDPSASTTVQACVGANLTVSKTATGSYDRLYTWDIDKSLAAGVPTKVVGGTSVDFPYTVTVTKTGYVDSGWTLSGTITVTNPNTWQDITAEVTDTLGLGGGAACTVAGGSSVVVLRGQSVTLDYSCTFASQPAYTGSNTATVTWDAAAAHTATGSAATTVPVELTLDQSTDQAITVSDTQYTPATPWTLDYLTAADSTPFTYTLTHVAKTGSCETFVNTAKIDQTGESDSVTATLCGGADLTVSKTATASFTRTYLWTIDKRGTSPAATLATSVSVPYTVDVLPNGYVDSAWTVTGTITVKNPNDWQSVTVSIADALDISGPTCTVNGGTTTLTLAAGESRTVNYTCTGQPSSYTGTNTATVTWDKAAAFTASGSATGSAGVTYVMTKEVNKVITVTDKVTGSTTVKTLGTVNWSTGITTVNTAGGVTGAIGGWQFRYSNTYAVPTNGCTSYTNTATITQTGQSDAVTVSVCGPPWIGDGTIGFWSNKNGQAIITGGAYTKTLVGTKYINVCNVTTWLRQFAPFQDLSATATCAQVGTYVLNVIKAANASGATMNAMLKAQMLAAALNYYYTTIEPRRSAPAGSLSTMVFDISPWSGAFGGATTMTLLQMLQYASSQSNVAGSIWYAQNKTTQGLAKDAFAAVNMSRILVVG